MFEHIQGKARLFRTNSYEETIEEYYVRMATDPMKERIWLGAKAMPQSRQWKLIDKFLKD